MDSTSSAPDRDRETGGTATPFLFRNQRRNPAGCTDTGTTGQTDLFMGQALRWARLGASAPRSPCLPFLLYFANRQRGGVESPSIGSERKTQFPHRRRFFDPGVCSRSGRAVSSGDLLLVVPLEQLQNLYELLGLRIFFEDNLIAPRFVGVCVLHTIVGTILPSGPLSAIASFGSSEGHSLSLGPPGSWPWAR
jgi:hypothetical protein